MRFNSVLKSRGLLLSLVLSLVTGGVMAVSAARVPDGLSEKPRPVTGEIPGQAIVRIISSASPASIEHLPGLSIRDSIAQLKTYLVAFDESEPVGGIVNALRSNPNVDFAEPNHARELPEMQQVSIGFPDQARPIFTFGVEPIDYYAQPGVYKTGIEEAHSLATGSGVTIAVIDNGIDFDHPLVQVSNVESGFDHLDNDIDASEEPGSLNGHGTAVAALVLLTAPDCTVLPIRAFDEEGVGNEFSISKALIWAANQGIDAINLSFGAPSNNQLMTLAVDYVSSQGITLIAAAGNSGNATPLYPAAAPEVIAVSAIDTAEIRASFASYGDHLTLVAPGVNIYSAMAGEFEWGTWNGTSFSAPLVTGTVAMLLERNPLLTPTLIREHFEQTVRTELLWGTIESPNEEYGYGALDAYQAVATVTLGDLDNNGTTDPDDLQVLLNHATGQQVLPPNQFQAGDLNCDGLVNLTDMTILAEFLEADNGRRKIKPCK